MKNCPFCNAEILDEAIFCVHCKSSLTVNETVNTNPDVKICPNCGNECNRNAILCVKCGSTLENKINTNNKQLTGTNDKEKLVSIFTIALCALGALGGIIVVISSLINGTDFSHVISSIISAIAGIVVTIGLIMGKKNKLPAIGYCISAVSIVVSLVVSYGSAFDKLLSLVSIVQVILVAVLYLGNKTIEKIWFLPVAICVISSVVYIIVNLLDGSYVYGYYYKTFGWSYFIMDVATNIGSIVGVVVTCLNAKLNWCSKEE